MFSSTTRVDDGPGDERLDEGHGLLDETAAEGTEQERSAAAHGDGLDGGPGMIRSSWSRRTVLAAPLIAFALCGSAWMVSPRAVHAQDGHAGSPHLFDEASNSVVPDKLSVPDSDQLIEAWEADGSEGKKSEDLPSGYCRPYQVDRRRGGGSCSCRRRGALWGWDGDYHCRGNSMVKKYAPPGPGATPDQDLLTVMTFNTYLLRIKFFGVIQYSESPDLDVRAAGIATWFNTLQPAEVPDVLVLQEIYSDEAQDLMRKICSSTWTKDTKVFSDYAHAPYIPCDEPSSRFGYGTRVTIPTAGNVVKSGGIVVLVRKGIEMEGATEDERFDDCAGQTCLSARGFWAVRLRKGTQPYLFIGTHAVAYTQYDETRQKQFQQIRTYIDDHTVEGDRVVIAGDMNVMSKDWVDENGKTVHPTEVPNMLNTLGCQNQNGCSKNAPATAGTHVPDGFWLKLNSPMADSATPTTNHYTHVIPEDARLGPQQYDWIIAPGDGDRLATPFEMRWQIAPINADTCYNSEQPGYPKGTTTDELSDHYGVFAAIRWTSDAPEYTTSVQGHRGHSQVLPSGPTC